MFKIYQIRTKSTHRIEYLNLYHVDENPQEVYRKNPDAQMFAGRLDLYLDTREETYATEEDAWAAVLLLFLQYKIVLTPMAKEEIIEANSIPEANIEVKEESQDEAKVKPEAKKRTRSKKSDDKSL